jgi:hypothetical protein
MLGNREILLYWMRCSLRRSLKQLRSSTRLYEALADRERSEPSRTLYQLLAAHQRGRAARKLSKLFSLGARVPPERDLLVARAWRQLLVMCGPRIAVRWIEWRENHELALIISVIAVVTRLTGD